MNALVGVMARMVTVVDGIDGCSLINQVAVMVIRLMEVARRVDATPESKVSIDLIRKREWMKQREGELRRGGLSRKG